MYAALVIGMLRGIHKTGQSSATALELLNEALLVRPVAGRYSATLYAFSIPLRALTFSNAGLPYPLLVSEAGCIPLGEGGRLPAFFPEPPTKATPPSFPPAMWCSSRLMAFMSFATGLIRILAGRSCGRSGKSAGADRPRSRSTFFSQKRGFLRGRQRTARRHYCSGVEGSRLAGFAAAWRMHGDAEENSGSKLPHST